MNLILAIYLGLALLFNWSIPESLSDEIKNTETVSFCTIASSPESYNGKVVRIRAILIQNHKVRVDGGDPFYYDPSCLGDQNYAYADFSQLNESQAKPAKLFDSEKARSKKDKYGNTRNTELFVARVTCVSGRGYGHLGWARFQLTVLRTEEFGAVKKNIQWPYSKRKGT